MINTKVTDIKNIRKSSIPYIISFIVFYGWILSFFTWWVNDYSSSYIFGGKQLFIINLFILILVAIYVFFIKPKNYNKYIKNGGLLSICSLVIYSFYLIFPSFYIIKYVLYLLPIFLGLIYAGFLSLYIYILNNSEKFYSIVLAYALVAGYTLLHYLFDVHVFNSYILFILLLVISILISFKFKTEDYIKEEEKFVKTAPKLKSILYLSVVIDCVFLIFVRSVGRAVLLTANSTLKYNIDIYYYIGALFGCIFLFLLYSFIKKCNSITWNIIYGLFILALFLYLSSMSPFIIKVYAFLLGCCITMGMCSMFYILGVISKKYWDYNYVKYNVVIIDIVGCCFGSLFGNYIYALNNVWTTNTIIIISFIIIVLFLIFSPLLVVTFFNDKWDEDSTKGLIDNLNIRKFAKYNLTNKEIEVCNHLLNNLTVRQIAVAMNISENTVKFHKKHIFDKLKISSKEELYKIVK